MDIICVKCGVINDYKTIIKSNQKTAWCNSCGSYIKNIPHNSTIKLYFGKYKNREIRQMTSEEEVNYLNWLLQSTVNISARLKNEIKDHLNIK